jgi:hypothetical protein
MAFTHTVQYIRNKEFAAEKISGGKIKRKIERKTERERDYRKKTKMKQLFVERYKKTG